MSGFNHTNTSLRCWYVKIACWPQAPWPVINLAEISTGPIAPFSNRPAATEGETVSCATYELKVQTKGWV